MSKKTPSDLRKRLAEKECVVGKKRPNYGDGKQVQSDSRHLLKIRSILGKLSLCLGLPIIIRNTDATVILRPGEFNPVIEVMIKTVTNAGQENWDGWVRLENLKPLAVPKAWIEKLLFGAFFDPRDRFAHISTNTARIE
ncbi:hypothetical protein B0H14DRAFT_2576850 [Mycena olivaceomarginata]|nr:hypothetical protein B0H14DRAFT_2576850 [Mycena olivaceomarginata]